MLTSQVSPQQKKFMLEVDILWKKKQHSCSSAAAKGVHCQLYKLCMSDVTIPLHVHISEAVF